MPYIGDKDALLHHLKKAVQELKYPRAITLDMLQNPKATSPNPKAQAILMERLISMRMSQKIYKTMCQIRKFNR
ncbi:hypothetical protein [Helicobacter cinaedi]|uniref:hypothetical protein n=1 Tax=Helicobacter cinaedi TaxID=213 RepID=UPI00215D88E8|nr:hypothetical protein [Helicobacter cinaedi]